MDAAVAHFKDCTNPKCPMCTLCTSNKALVFFVEDRVNGPGAYKCRVCASKPGALEQGYSLQCSQPKGFPEAGPDALKAIRALEV